MVSPSTSVYLARMIGRVSFLLTCTSASRAHAIGKAACVLCVRMYANCRADAIEYIRPFSKLMWWLVSGV